ncbi:MAG: hypothetical protein AB7F99_19580 [Vicinamibacterales bacterium]
MSTRLTETLVHTRSGPIAAPIIRYHRLTRGAVTDPNTIVFRIDQAPMFLTW